VYLPSSGGGVIPERVSGWGRRSGTSDWVYSDATWSDLNEGGGSPKVDCYDQGADTVGGGSDFYALSGAETAGAAEGDLISLYAELVLRFDGSTLRPGSTALMRREGSGSLVEFASGLSAASGFEYRLQGQSAFQSQITGAQLDEIAEIRVIAIAEGEDQVGGGPSTYRWDVRIPLRNVP
jgi:hypothetical protein